LEALVDDDEVEGAARGVQLGIQQVEGLLGLTLLLEHHHRHGHLRNELVRGDHVVLLHAKDDRLATHVVCIGDADLLVPLGVLLPVAVGLRLAVVVSHRDFDIRRRVREQVPVRKVVCSHNLDDEIS